MKKKLESTGINSPINGPRGGVYRDASAEEDFTGPDATAAGVGLIYVPPWTKQLGGNRDPTDIEVLMYVRLLATTPT